MALLWTVVIVAAGLQGLAQSAPAGEQPDKPIEPKPGLCLKYKPWVLYWYNKCKKEFNNEGKCHTLKDCPSTCTSNGQTRQRNAKWVKRNGTVIFDCRCGHPYTWVFPSILSIPRGAPAIPPRVICTLRGCRRDNRGNTYTYMKYGEFFFADDGKEKCTCVNRPNPSIADDSPPSHIDCQIGCVLKDKHVEVGKTVSIKMLGGGELKCTCIGERDPTSRRKRAYFRC